MRNYLRLGWALLRRSFWQRIYHYAEKKYLSATSEVISLSIKVEMAKE